METRNRRYRNHLGTAIDLHITIMTAADLSGTIFQARFALDPYTLSGFGQDEASAITDLFRVTRDTPGAASSGLIGSGL